jgi:hypothetical protein
MKAAASVAPVFIALPVGSLPTCVFPPFTNGQVHSLPGALPAQLVRPARPFESLSTFRKFPFIDGQVQSLPGALPAQLVRPEDGKVTWILDADAAAGIGAEKWEEPAKTDFPRSNV